MSGAFGDATSRAFSHSTSGSVGGISAETASQKVYVLRMIAAHAHLRNRHRTLDLLLSYEDEVVELSFVIGGQLATRSGKRTWTASKV